MREIFEKLGEEMAAAGHGGILPAGLVLTGGAAQLAGIAELGRDVLQMPVRVAAPAGVGGLADNLLTPEFSTSIGLLQWGARAGMEDERRALRLGACGRSRSAASGTGSGASSPRSPRAAPVAPTVPAPGARVVRPPAAPVAGAHRHPSRVLPPCVTVGLYSADPNRPEGARARRCARIGP